MIIILKNFTDIPYLYHSNYRYNYLIQLLLFWHVVNIIYMNFDPVI